MPAPQKTVSVFGYDLPVLDDMLFGETQDLQKAYRRWQAEGSGRLEQWLDSARIVLFYRLDVVLPPFDPKKPVAFDPDALEEAMMELTAPFLRAEAESIRKKKQKLIAARLPAFSAELNRLDHELAKESAGDD